MFVRIQRTVWIFHFHSLNDFKQMNLCFVTLSRQKVFQAEVLFTKKSDKNCRIKSDKCR